MKKNTLQKVLSASLVGAMAVTMLAGCGNSETASEPTEKATESAPIAEVEQVEVQEEAGMASWTPFEETVTLQVPVYDRGGEVDVTSNYWTNWIQENFGDAYNIKCRVCSNSTWRRSECLCKPCKLWIAPNNPYGVRLPEAGTVG